MNNAMPGGRGWDRMKGMENPSSCENEVHDLWNRLEAQFGSEGTQALNTFAESGEIAPDVDPLIASELATLSSTYGAPMVEEAIKKLAA
jgi:hypothetical protein